MREELLYIYLDVLPYRGGRMYKPELAETEQNLHFEEIEGADIFEISTSEATHTHSSIYVLMFFEIKRRFSFEYLHQLQGF